MKTNKILKGLGLSIVSLIAGFVAIGVPFRIFSTLSADGMRTLFITELVVYLVIGLIFLTIQDKKNREKAKEAQRLEERNLKIKKVVDEWYNIAA